MTLTLSFPSFLLSYPFFFFPQQTLEADALCQVSIKEGVLIALVSLLDLTFVPNYLKKNINLKKFIIIW